MFPARTSKLQIEESVGGQVNRSTDTWLQQWPVSQDVDEFTGIVVPLIHGQGFFVAHPQPQYHEHGIASRSIGVICRRAAEPVWTTTEVDGTEHVGHARQFINYVSAEQWMGQDN